MPVEVPDSIRTSISARKDQLRAQCDVVKRFAEVRSHMTAEAEAIQAAVDSDLSVIPEINFADIAAGSVPDKIRGAIHRRGCVIVRQVFDRATAQGWNTDLGDYLESNNYLGHMSARDGDEFFDNKKPGPQIFGIYWSRPQVLARQAESMAQTKQFLHRLWDVAAPGGVEFDPDNDLSYADRIRRRDPGDATLGLRPHVDSGSFERWVDPAFQEIYGPIFGDDWQSYDPWKAAHRTKTREYDAPTVCSAFRTFQGWTALTTQGPQTGTLRLLPVANAMAYVLLRSLQPDVTNDELILAAPGRALRVDHDHHPELLAAMVSIPVVEPGDTVWWHPDLVHAVEDEHRGAGQANVMYIAATPSCPKNLAYARRQAPHFLDGRSAPDFPAEDFEVDFADRATVADLTPLGRRQMAL